MSTTARIAILNKDSIVRSVYCHDGELATVAPHLLMYYNVPERVKSLIDLGGLSYLGKRLSKDDRFGDSDSSARVTFSYSRDRGERKIINHYTDYDGFLSDYQHKQDFNFIYFEAKKTWYLLVGLNNEKKNLKSIVKKLYESKEMFPLFLDDYEEYLKNQVVEKKKIALESHLSSLAVKEDKYKDRTKVRMKI